MEKNCWNCISSWVWRWISVCLDPRREQQVNSRPAATYIASLRLSWATGNPILNKKYKTFENREHNITWTTGTFFNDMALGGEGNEWKDNENRKLGIRRDCTAYVLPPKSVFKGVTSYIQLSWKEKWYSVNILHKENTGYLPGFIAQAQRSLSTDNHNPLG